MLLFEMEEDPQGIHIRNEVTGNWCQAIGGHAARYAAPVPCREIPCFTQDPRG